MDKYYMAKNVITIIVFTLSLLLFQPYSYSEITQSEWDTVYNLTEDYVRQGKWEEAISSFKYLSYLTKLHNQQDRFQNLSQLEKQAHELIDKNLESLYQEGQNQLNNSEFSKALMTFRKILYYYPDYQNTRDLLEKTQNLSNSARGIQQKTIIVTSKTPDKKQTGLRVYKPEKCFNGYTLFLPQTLGEITPLGYIYLIDINGDIIYQWMTTKGSPVFAQLKPDGNIIYNDIDYSGLQELDLQSNMVWNYPGLIDHDFRFLKDNNFLITRLENEDDGCSAGFSRIEIVTADKKVLWQWKAEEHIEELERLVGLKTPIGDWANDTCKILKDTPLVKKDSLFRIGDWALINTCEILKDTPLAKNDFRFKEGNIIFSFDILSAIGIIDYPSGEIVWAWGSGILERQHTPTMLDNGNILIFDNGTKRGWSRVIELNPITEQIVWEYHAEPKEDFFSSWMSSATRLPNGNTLICESTSNRIFEITPQGEIVWDFISTFHKTTGVGEGIYRAYRYSPEYVQPLLDKINQWQNQQKATIIR